MKTIVWSPGARRALRGLPDEVARRVCAKLERYARTGAGDVRTLVESDLRRLRIGDYRVLFAEDVERLAIVRIGHRSSIY